MTKRPTAALPASPKPPSDRPAPPLAKSFSLGTSNLNDFA